MKKKRVTMVVCMLMALALVLCACGDSSKEEYDAACSLFQNGRYSDARKAFRALGDYEDSKAMITACDYHMAITQLSNEEYVGAAAAFATLGDYGNADALRRAAEMLAALQLYEDGDTEGAIAALSGTRIAQDLTDSQSGTKELADLVGTWSGSVDIQAELKAAFLELAGKQDKLDKSMVEGFDLKEMPVKVSLEVQKDGLAVLKLEKDELDRAKASFATQLHEVLTAFCDQVIDYLADEEGCSREEYLKSHDVTDVGSFIEEKMEISFEEFERQLIPAQVFSKMGDYYNDSGVARINTGVLELHFPEHTWTVDDTKDGKLTVTNGSNSLTLTRIS